MKRTVQVLSSKGDSHYQVTIEDGKAVSCPCAGYTHRQKCRHLGEAEEMDLAEARKQQKKWKD